MFKVRKRPFMHVFLQAANGKVQHYYTNVTITAATVIGGLDCV